MNKMLKRYGFFGLLTVLLLLFDQWTKSLAYNGLRVNGPLVLINGVC